MNWNGAIAIYFNYGRVLGIRNKWTEIICLLYHALYTALYVSETNELKLSHHSNPYESRKISLCIRNKWTEIETIKAIQELRASGLYQKQMNWNLLTDM